VGLPTETVYGLAGNAFDPMAIARIFEAKSRPLSDPLIVHIPEMGWLERVVRFSSENHRTLVGRLAAKFVAVRVTSHPLFQEVLRGIGSPLAAPSANRFGRISPTSAHDVQLELGESIDLILDGGSCEHGLESTIVALREGGLEILRPGPITGDQLKKYGQVFTPNGIVNTPGSLPGHYAPKKELHIIESDINGFIPRANSSYLAFTTPSSEIRKRFSQVEVLSPLGDLREAAANFYGALRRLDNSKADMIYAMRLPEEGIGLAIMDRLQRASFGSKHPSQSH
jgi:L-threonylcarbamoyladenylate synthase